MRLPTGHRLLLLAIVASIDPAVARAQRQALAPGAQAIEVHVSERQLNGRQQPRFTRFREDAFWLFVDSVHRANGSREVYVSFGEPRGVRGTIVTTPEGGLTRLTIASSRRRGPSAESPAALRHYERASLFVDFDGPLVLPATKLWDIVPSFHPPRLAPGARWIDSLYWPAESLGNRQTLIGTRVSRILADTSIDGKRLWIVADTAVARYHERALREERTLDTLVIVTRTGSVTIHGRMIYDPALGLARVRDDTLRLAGSAVLRYPDGRSFPTAAHDERIRHAVLYDSAAYRARRAALRAEAERNYSGGVVIVATDSLDRRMEKGDTAARDSIVRLWRSATTPNEYVRLYERLAQWNRRATAFVQWLNETRLADGDTVFLLDNLGKDEYRDRRTPLDTARMRQLIGVLSDPGLLFAFGLERDPFYEDLAQALYTYPPAAARDTTEWPCLPAACRMLAEQYPTAAEPRLRRVALVARFVLDPHTWTDTLVAHAHESESLFSSPLMLARGVGATWPAASHRPLPPAGADWRAWTDWMNGKDSAMARRHPTPEALRATLDSPLRFEDTHATALRFTAARTGRDIVGELRRQRARSRSDSARLVYEYMLINLDELQPTVESVAALLRSSSPAKHTLGVQEVVKLFTGKTERADSATTDSLQDVLIATALEHHGKRWRSLQPEPGTSPGAAPPPMREAPNERTFLLADSISAGLRAKWTSHVPVITRAEWDRRSDREGGTLFTLTSVSRLGPFARLGVDSFGRIPRQPNQAPWLYFAQTTYYLMQFQGEWVLVTMERWIT